MTPEVSPNKASFFSTVCVHYAWSALKLVRSFAQKFFKETSKEISIEHTTTETTTTVHKVVIKVPDGMKFSPKMIETCAVVIENQVRRSLPHGNEPHR
jgi:hypothetical protein